ncbi:hypothetical protein C1X05_14700 [Laceyella sacchari]|uniref:Uncharacterized protein n=2 Tax=Laceyella TaxID=292635 RepID=A0AA46AFX0_9BACL|nr:MULTISPECIES: hypothetical protein [Laceyella]AUS09951.1 hypothetical protein C1X05_14700 [Laceyella sacchari]PRZ12696.1 hypothetical protein CLV36_11294 [Laceyella sediminis]SMP22654.1 hypothetical protein SAMN06265361_10484 [Laceyella tengchongensis]
MGLAMTAKRRVTTDILRFLNDRVLSVTQLTRSKKLTEILDSYSQEKSTDVYVIQNVKKPGKAVIADLKYFEELLAYKEAVDWALDHAIEEIALERKETIADIPLPQVIQDNQLDLNYIMKLVDEVEEED